MNILSQNEMQFQIQKLIDSQSGDIGRLRFILEILTKRNMIFNSDKKYLENKFDSKFILKQPEISSKKEDVLKLIPKIMELGLGDPGRLEFIYQTLKKGKALYKSDQKYLNTKFQIMKNILKKRYQKVGPVSKTRVKSYSKLVTTEKLDKLSTPKSILYIKDSNLSQSKSADSSELTEQKKRLELESIMPKYDINQQQKHREIELQKINEQVKEEEEKLSQEKILTEKISRQETELMRIKLELKEVEGQGRIEAAKLEEQIRSLPEVRAEEVKFIEQIKLQASQLKEEIAERDKIAQQTKMVYSMLVEQIQGEKGKRAEEVKVAEQVKQEQEDLEKTSVERDKIAQTMIEIVKQKEQINGQQIKFEEEKKSEKDKLTLVRERQKDIVREIEHEKLTEQINLEEKIKKQHDELKKKKQSNMDDKT